MSDTNLVKVSGSNIKTTHVVTSIRPHDFNPVEYFDCEDQYELYQHDKVYEYYTTDHTIEKYIIYDLCDNINNSVEYVLIKKIGNSQKPILKPKLMYYNHNYNCQCFICTSRIINYMQSITCLAVFGV